MQTCYPSTFRREVYSKISSLSFTVRFYKITLFFFQILPRGFPARSVVPGEAAEEEERLKPFRELFSQKKIVVLLFILLYNKIFN